MRWNSGGAEGGAEDGAEGGAEGGCDDEELKTEILAPVAGRSTAAAGVRHAATLELLEVVGAAHLRAAVQRLICDRPLSVPMRNTY